MSDRRYGARDTAWLKPWRPEGDFIAVKTWFITGTSRGFGREWAIAALDRGDRVAATARDIASLDELAAKYGDAILPIRLDVTDRGADFAAVKLAHDYFGRLDVVVNNAGYGQFGMVEEISESEIRAQLETNLLGALWVPQAALPLVDTPDPPLRLFLGEAPLGIATADYESRLAAWRTWQPAAAQGDGS